MTSLHDRLDDLRARLALWRCTRVGQHPRVYGRVWIHGGGRVLLGHRVVLDGSHVAIELKAEPGGELRIGDDVRLEGGTSIEASRSIIIGARCRLGPFAKLLDNHFHPLIGDRRFRPPSAPIVLEDDVRVGAHSIVLPGSHLGRGVTLEPRTVVARRVPAGRVLAGNPARLVTRGPPP
jgi:acetyltransferase-like isoleucine patch superfamily enzyme